MIPFWRKRRPSLQALSLQQAGDCARIHATGFAYPWSRREFETLIADPACVGLAAHSPTRKALGFVLSRLAADEAEVLTIAVDPAHRRSGLGRQLLSAHLPQIAEAGGLRLFLEVDENNSAALALYRQFGFFKVGERRGYYAQPGSPPASAVVMRRDFV